MEYLAIYRVFYVYTRYIEMLYFEWYKWNKGFEY